MSDSNASLNASEENDEFISQGTQLPQMKGTLSKWTNYITGWQDRWVTCSEGILSYYRSENEIDYGCRGSIYLSEASITSHEFDPCRFDITINDSVWCMRAPDEAACRQWIENIEANKAESGYGSDESTMSITNWVSSSPFVKGGGLYEKLAELETFRDILCGQVDTLQKHFDACAHSEEHTDYLNSNSDEKRDYKDDETGALNRRENLGSDDVPYHPGEIDFKGEAITFKATTAGIIATLSHCIDLMSTREDTWQRRLEKEKEKRFRLEEQLGQHVDLKIQDKDISKSPDVEDTENEDEFFDAETETAKEEKPGHRYSQELDRRIREHLIDSVKDPSKEEEWDLFTEEGGMKIYRKQEEGSVCDPLKAIHLVDGVSAHEMCHYFWKSDFRMEWDVTIESFRVLEAPDDRTSVIYQNHKRVWPASQRDCLYVSSLEQVNDLLPITEDEEKPHDAYIVCNFSIDDHSDNMAVAGCVRAVASIALICQTFVTPPPGGAAIDRSCIKCKFVYAANVDPGGYIPSSLLNAAYKREYPRFLREFMAYVKKRTENKEIMF